MKTTPALGLLISLSACGAVMPSTETPAARTEATLSDEVTDRCGDSIGAWSRPVAGLRGRIVVSEAGGTLHVAIELQNVGEQPIARHWDGSPSVGFATFALRDAEGRGASRCPTGSSVATKRQAPSRW